MYCPRMDAGVVGCKLKSSCNCIRQGVFPDLRTGHTILVADLPRMTEKLHTPPEILAYRKHFSELSHAVREPAWLASELFSEGLISFEAMDEAVSVRGVSCIQRTRQVLCHFKKTLADQPEVFHQFLSIVRKERSLQWLANRIEATYSES